MHLYTLYYLFAKKAIFKLFLLSTPSTSRTVIALLIQCRRLVTCIFVILIVAKWPHRAHCLPYLMPTPQELCYGTLPCIRSGNSYRQLCTLINIPCSDDTRARRTRAEGKLRLMSLLTSSDFTREHQVIVFLQRPHGSSHVPSGSIVDE